MTDALFEADDYLAPGARPRKTIARTAPEPVDTVEVRAGGIWSLVVKAEPGVVHAHVANWRKATTLQPKAPSTAAVTYCGRYGSPRTFEPGQLVQGCAACAAGGAPT